MPGGNRPGQLAGPRNPFQPQFQSPHRGIPNPITPRFQNVTPGLFPRPVVQVPRHLAPVPIGNPVPGSNWQQVQNMAAQGNTREATALMTRQLGNNPNLPGLMSAVGALERSQNNSLVQPLRQQALQMARTEIAAGSKSELPWVAMAKFSLEDQHDAEFRKATSHLAQQFPNDKMSHYYVGIRELKDGNYKTAESSLRKAREMGMPEESINELIRLAIDGQAWIWEYAQIVGIAILVWLSGLAFLFVAGKVLSGMVVRAIDRASLDEVTTGDRMLRMIYRWLISFAGFYYYLSLPMLLISSVALPLSIGYGLLLLPSITFPLLILVVLLALFGLLTAISGIRAAFVRIKDEDPGFPLTPEDAPELWKELKTIAERVGTRPIDQVWLTHGTEMAVVERGSYWQRRRDRGKRALILGVALLEGFRLDAFRAVIAHEYGHFRHRDTAGGDVALRVKAAMMQFAAKIVERGKIRVWDLAVHFLRFYHRLFHRLSFGASRLQEVLADRVAVVTCGADAMAEGLKHVIRRSIEFDYLMSNQYSRHLQSASIKRLYRRKHSIPITDQGQVETILHRIMTEASTDQDTHPSPKERNELAKRVPASASAFMADARELPALFPDHKKLQTAMEARIAEAMKAQADVINQVGKEIVRRISNAIERAPSLDLYFDRARFYYSQGKFKQAMGDVELILEHQPQALVIRTFRMQLLSELGQHNEATEELEYLLKNDRHQSDETMQIAGEIYLKADQADKSVVYLTRALNQGPKTWARYVLRAKAYSQLGNEDLARKDLQAACQTFPNSEALLFSDGEMKLPGVH
jgi:Zn-dependent protease with chaperone function/regulator of sirC expression with transglutaminase-like and TPR domain